MDLDSPTDQSQCRLLMLPPELRNHIWSLILLQNTRQHYGSFVLLDLEASRLRSRFCANVLRTCKQINAEGTPILYGENIFSAHRNLLATLPSFILDLRSTPNCCPPVLSMRVAKLIRRFHVFVRLDTDPRFSARQVEESFNAVDELHIDVFQSMYGSCDFSVLSLFEGVRGVKKVKIDGSLGDRRYANWLADAIKLPLGEIPQPFHEEYVGGMRAWDAWAHGQR